MLAHRQVVGGSQSVSENADNPVVKQFGLGMSVAILVDATIVRCLLVPAVMVLLGDANWWLPRWPRWLPHIGLDQAPEKKPQRDA